MALVNELVPKKRPEAEKLLGKPLCCPDIALGTNAFIFDVQVTQVDIDVFGHATYNSYVRWQNMAADAFLLKRFPSYISLLTARKLWFAVRYVSMKYRAGANFGDVVRIVVNSSNAQQTTFDLLFTFLVKETGELLGLGKQTLQLKGENHSQASIADVGLKEALLQVEVDPANARKY